MKKFIFAIIFVLVGCAATEETEVSIEPQSESTVFSFDYFENIEIPERSWGGGGEDSVNPMIKYLGELEHFPPPPFEVDVDFTVFGGEEFDEQFSQIMFWRPDEFYGKSLRLIGPYLRFYDEVVEQDYHLLLVDDAMGCCFRYVEFAFSEGSVHSEYPEDYTIIDIAGVFGTYFDEAIQWEIQFLEINELIILEGAEYVAPSWSDI
ncbi:MAG: hypothetical protein LBI27_04020 [Clostridiales bacterium]|jgi:hypothetical protein|nr:hypothetical protein [Clostridiales bacterium]